MGLSARERRCIEALCAHLGSHRGGRWHIVDGSLDAKHPNQRSPEAITSGGDDAIAPWTTVEEVLSRLDVKPHLSDDLKTMTPPTDEQLTILRAEIDPDGLTLARGE